MGLFLFVSKLIEEVIVVNFKIFFQVYWQGGCDVFVECVEWVWQVGVVGLVVIIDWMFLYGCDWGSFKIFEEMNLKIILWLFLEVIIWLRWLWKFVKMLWLLDLWVFNQGWCGEFGLLFFVVYGEWMVIFLLIWEDIGWLCELWGGLFMFKGVMWVDDVKRVVDVGVLVILVFNYGGNNLDGMLVLIWVLFVVLVVVGDQVEVLFDGGIWWGSDVVKVVVLGVCVVMIGCVYLWGLVVNG